MAISIAGHSSSGFSNNATSYTLSSYTPAAGSSCVLVVRVHGLFITNNTNPFTVDSVTFGGVALTQAVTVRHTSASRVYRAAIWYLINPSASPGNIVVGFSIGSGGCIIAADTLVGAQTSPLGNTGSGTSDVAAVTGSVANPVAGSLILSAVVSHCQDNPAWSWGDSDTPTSASIEQYEIRTASDVNNEVAGAGAYTLHVTNPNPFGVEATRSTGRPQAMVVAEFLAAGGGVLSATATDALDVADAPSRRAIYRRTAADGLAAADVRARQAIYRKTSADILSAVETRTGRGIYRRSVSESLDLLAALTPRRVLRAAAVEALGMSGGMGPRRTRRPALVDLLDLLEAAAGGGRVTATAADAVDVTATTGARWTLRRVAADTWRLTDATAGRRDRRATAADGLELHESAAYPLPGGGGSLRVLPSADGWEDMDNGSVSLSIIVGGVPGWNAFKFDNLDIPPGATIQAASLEIWSYINDDPNLTIAAQASASPANLTEDEYNISLRPLTDSSVAWSAANVGLNQYVETPDFAEVVAAVTGLLEWEQGVSDLVLILYGTSGNIAFYSLEGSHPPYLNITWTSGGLTITAEAADLLDLLDDAERRALIAAATADSVSWAAAATVALSLLVAEPWQLSEMVLTLARLRVNDVTLLGDAVYLAYAVSITEPVSLHVALQRIATARAAPVDALRYGDALRTTVNTSAGDALDLTDALAARRLLAAIVHDATAYAALVRGDMPGLLDAIVTERFTLGGAARSGWHGHPAAADALAADEVLATLRRFRAAVIEAGAWDDVAAATRRVRPTATDAARLAEMLRTRSAARAADTLEWSAATVERLLSILRAVAADGLELSAGTAVAWRVTARDSLEFAAALGRIMHWVAAAGDEWGLHGVAVTLLPNGIVRIELAMLQAGIAFEIAMPRADVALQQPSVVIEPHGLTDR